MLKMTSNVCNMNTSFYSLEICASCFIFSFVVLLDICIYIEHHHVHVGYMQSYWDRSLPSEVGPESDSTG